MSVKLRIILFLYIFLNSFYTSDARANGVRNTETTPLSASGDAVESCSSSSPTSLKCPSSNPGQTSNFEIQLVQELYQNLVQAVLEKSNMEDSAALRSPSSRFNVNIDTILATFHDVYRYYLPVPHIIGIPATTKSRLTSPEIDLEKLASTLGQEDPASLASKEEVSWGRDEKEDGEFVQVEDDQVPPRLSSECATDVLAIYKVFNRTKSVLNDRAVSAAVLLEYIWPLKMMDSWGKAEDGILVGNLRRLGFMRECLDTVAGAPLGFSGQYCLVQPVKTSNDSPAGLLPALYGTCIPSSCTSQELQSSLNYQLAPLNHKAGSVSCQQRDEAQHFGAWEISASAIIGAMVLMVLGATIVDLIWREKSHFVFKAFSAAENMGKIWAVKKDELGEISCLYGIRVLSISWIILGHHYAYIMEYGVNKAELPQMTSGWPFQMVWSGYKAVDTFFTISGLLLVTSLLKENFCIVGTSDPRAGNDMESVAPASTLTLVRTSSKSSETSFVEEPVEEPAKPPTMQECTPAVLLKEDSIFDIALWNTLVRQGLGKTVVTFLHSYLKYILKRIVRLWPTMFLIVMYCAGPSTFFIYGPFKPRYEEEYLHACRVNWWVDLTFFSNIIFVITGRMAENDPEYKLPVDSCISHSWYIAVDWQLQLVMPFLILPCKMLPRKKGLCILFFIVLASLIPGLIVILKDLMPAMLLTLNNRAILDYSREIYMMPYARASPYLVGGLCGLLLLQARTGQQGSDVQSLPNWLTIAHKKRVQFLGWMVFFATSLAIIFGLSHSNVIATHVHQLSSLETFLYASLASTAWAICVGWMVMMCTLGLAGPINLFLSHPMWQPLSRVSYSVYLISLPIQKMIFYSFDRDIYLTHSIIILSCCGVVVVSFLASFAISLVAESPFISLLKFIVKRQTWKDKEL